MWQPAAGGTPFRGGILFNQAAICPYEKEEDWLETLFFICCVPAKLTSLIMPWKDALDLTPRQRDWLVKKLDEVRNKEISAMKRR